MKLSTKLIAITCIILLLAPFWAWPQVAPVKITSVEGITEYKLSNGLHVLLFPDESKPTITVNVTYLVGSRMEGYGETGMAHLLEHMMFKGSTNHPNVPQELTAHGAQPNGSTWYDRTNYFETFAASDENLKWALDLESDRMINSFIAKKDLESEFSVVRNEFEMGENYPSNILMERVLSTAYIWHNYGKATIGSKEDIERVPIESLQAFYHKYYQPDNAVLLVAGKIDEAKTLALISNYFGKLQKPARVIAEPYTVEPVQDGERFVELSRTGDVQVVSCAYHISNGAHPDFAAVDVLADVLTNEPAGRLYKALVETKKASQLWGYAQALKDPGFIYFSADILREKPLEDVRKTMMDLMDSLKFHPVTADEVERAKNKILKNFELTYNSSEDVGLTLSEFIAQGDWRLWFLYRDRVEKITADDVNRVVNTYFKSSNRTMGLFMPETNPDRAMIPANPDLATTLKDYKGKEKLGDAEKFDASCDNIDKRTKTGTIAGGAKYALLKKTTRGESVNVKLTLRIGSRTSLQNKATLAEITSQMLKKGTADKTEQQINDELDKLKAQVSIYGGGQNVVVRIETVNKNLVGVLKLVTDILRKPSFQNSEFEKVVQQELDQIEQQKTEPQSIAMNVFNRATSPYPEGDFRRLLTFDEQVAAVKAVTPEGVKKFYNDYYNGAHATVAVVGDFDEEAVTKQLNEMLENWKSAEKYERAPSQFFDVAAKSDKINTPDKTNAMLIAGYNIEMRDDDPDYPVLQMGNFMLGGGFLNSRLAERIRQKEGISYGVGSWVDADAFDKTGSFGTYAIYNPLNAEKLVSAYKEELSKMLDKGFTADELKDARAGYLQERSVNRSKDDYLASRLDDNLHMDRTMKFSKNMEDKIMALKLEDVNAVMRKWIKPEKIYYVQAGDFEKKGN
jgi:zinc protease